MSRASSALQLWRWQASVHNVIVRKSVHGSIVVLGRSVRVGNGIRPEFGAGSSVGGQVGRLVGEPGANAVGRAGRAGGRGEGRARSVRITIRQLEAWSNGAAGEALTMVRAVDAPDPSRADRALPPFAAAPKL